MMTAIESSTKLQSASEKFKEQGYLIFDLKLPDFDKLAESIITQLEPSYGEHFKRLQNAWFYSHDVRKLALNKQVIDMLRILYQREPLPFQTLNFNVGTQQPTHSDTIHFNSVPESFMCGVWVALEDIDEENGPLHYYPSSHKLPVKTMQDFDLQPERKSYTQYEEKVQEMLEQSEFEKEYGLIRKGQAILWDANLYHGGSKILDIARSRHSQVTHYFFEDCLYYIPMYSNVKKNDFALRAFNDIRTGKVAKHYQDGKRFHSNPKDRLNSFLGNLICRHPRIAAHYYPFLKKYLYL